MAGQRQADGRSDEQATPVKAVGRRGLIAGAAALVAGIAAKQASQPIGATTGSLGNVGFYAQPNSFPADGTSFPTGQIGLAGSTSTSFGSPGDINAAVYAYSPTSYGVWARCAAVGGTAIYGDVIAGSSGNPVAIHGLSAANVAGAIAVEGQAVNGTGSIGVLGLNESFYPGAIGVKGSISTTAAANTVAVQGVNQSTGTGGVGVSGISTKGPGVVGSTQAAGSGVAGGYFYTTADSGSGVVGQCFNPGGGAAAFVGAAVAPNYAAYFTGNVVVNGKLVVSDPSYKSGALRHPDGSTRLVYCVESPESWIEDVGTGTLAGGKASVTFDKDFAAVTHTDDYHVFLTPYDGACKGLGVITRHADGFVVQELNGGASSGTFSWKVMVKARSEVKAERLGKFAMPTIKLADTPPKFAAPVPPSRP